jgi:hypothetical protein
VGIKESRKVINLGNMGHVAMQLLDFVPKSGRIMQYTVEHYCAEVSTQLLQKILHSAIENEDNVDYFSQL